MAVRGRLAQVGWRRRLPLLAALVAGSATGLGGSLWLAGNADPLGGDGARARAEEAHRLARHRAEPVDQTWSAAARARVHKHLTESARSAKASLVTVGCRRSSCVAEIEWPDHAAAVENVRDLVTLSTWQKCTSGMALTDPVPSAGAYRARFIVDCSDNRAALAH